jgi:hypothetical protein
MNSFILKMNKFRVAFSILSLFFLHYTPTKAVTNGCGSKISIDYILKLKGLKDLIPCCDDHDECYG